MASRKTKSRFSLPEAAAAMPRRRPARIADAIRNEVATLLLRQIKDPRVQHVTITEVRVTDDLRTAFIHFSIFGNDTTVPKAEQGLDSAKGFIRSHLAKTLGLRYVPQLIFKHDLSQVRQAELEKLLQEIRDENGPTPQ